jgi:hypothetical protein
VTVAAAVVLAGASVAVLPRSLGYDPWSWLIWGREIGHLALDTRHAATSVKPLPMAVDTVLATAGAAAPWLWLWVARAGALLSLALAFRVGRRVGGVVAGSVAAIGLALADQYLSTLYLMGIADPLVAGTVLAAVDSRLRSRPRAALAFLVTAALLRPEAWPALVAACWWQVRKSALWRQALAVTGAALVPALWFALDWFGARQLSRSAEAATHESQGGPLLSQVPGLATFGETWSLLSGPVLALFLVGTVVAVRRWRAGGHPGPVLWLSAGAVGWVTIDAVLAQLRLATGAPRYLLGGAALACVVAGWLVGEAVGRLRRRPADSRLSTAAPWLLAAVLVLASLPRLVGVAGQVDRALQNASRTQTLQATLPQAIAAAGGRKAILRCGRISTSTFQVPLLAWQLEVPIRAVRVVRPGAKGTVIEAAPKSSTWQVRTTCPTS